MDIREYLAENRIITDGSMGTFYDRLSGYRGEMAERGNLTHPELIQQIHRLYIEAGARLIRTNTFAVNSMFFGDKQTVKETIAAAWHHAEAAVMQSTNGNIRDCVWIAADMGPIDESEVRDKGAVIEEYKELCDCFLSLGATVFVFETLSEFTYVREAAAYIKQIQPEAFIVTQFSFNRNGYTRAGMSVGAVLSEAADIQDIDAVGFNCGVGPVHLYELLKDAAFPQGKFLTALPNAGYPVELRGRTMYSENVSYYVEMMAKIAELGFDFVGGCCGTTPDHIRGMYTLLAEGKRPPRKLMAAGRRGDTGAASVTAFMRKLYDGEKVFAVELDPPFDANDSKLMAGVQVLKELGTDMITLADSPLARPRADAIASAVKIHYTQNMAVMPHISCRDRNAIALRGQLIGMHMNDLRHALIVTGDPIARGDRESIKSVFNFNSIKLMRYVQTMNQELFGNTPMFYGGALNHNNGSVENIAARMRQKIEAGASYFLTQPVYGQEDIDRLRVLKEQSGGRILAGIMPLVSRKNALFIRNEMPGIHVPDAVLAQYEEGLTREAYEDVAVAISIDLIKRLRDSCDGYYLMIPFNRVSLIERIIKLARKELI